MVSQFTRSVGTGKERKGTNHINRYKKHQVKVAIKRGRETMQ